MSYELVQHTLCIVEKMLESCVAEGGDFDLPVDDVLAWHGS